MHSYGRKTEISHFGESLLIGFGQCQSIKNSQNFQDQLVALGKI